MKQYITTQINISISFCLTYIHMTIATIFWLLFFHAFFVDFIDSSPKRLVKQVSNDFFIWLFVFSFIHYQLTIPNIGTSSWISLSSMLVQDIFISGALLLDSTNFFKGVEIYFLFIFDVWAWYRCMYCLCILLITKSITFILSEVQIIFSKLVINWLILSCFL